MAGLPAPAQITQFLPEVDVYSGLTSNTQFWFQAKQTREDGAPTQAEIGHSFNFFVKPLLKLKTRTYSTWTTPRKDCWYYRLGIVICLRRTLLRKIESCSWLPRTFP
jgi:hypothetical protein